MPGEPTKTPSAAPVPTQDATQSPTPAMPTATPAAPLAEAPDAARWRADPLADATIASILGAAGTPMPEAEQTATIAILNSQISQWQNNAALATWRADASVPAPMAAALEAFLQAAQPLPAWADTAKIARAENLFMGMSMLSCTLLFCASLPECYVIPDLAAVLHASGQLERHTDYRVRATAAMIFPVMMHGGLTGGDGGGVAQTLKVRLIHATIRHLVLRGESLQEGGRAALLKPLPPSGPGMHQALYALGWDVARDGLPCNQDELAYTLLTFHYVFLRALHRLGIGLPPADEEAYLHIWNVMGHLLGIERALMPATMAQAEAMFTELQARGRTQHCLPDVRPSLGHALMNTMAAQLPLRILKPFPVLLTRYLCGATTSADLGIMYRVSWLSRAVFAVGVLLVRGIDAAVRLFLPTFSICRLVSRVLGYQFTVKLLMDQTRPLALPDALLNQLNGVVAAWHYDPKAPRWMNKLETRLTGRAPDAGAAPAPPQGTT